MVYVEMVHLLDIRVYEIDFYSFRKYGTPWCSKCRLPSKNCYQF